MFTDREVTITRFPTSQGDTQTKVMLSTLTKDKVFKSGMAVVMDSKTYTDWDSLLTDIQRKPIEQPVEIVQYVPVSGG